MYRPCIYSVGGGMKCVREEAHGPEIPLLWSKHTMRHEEAGHGWACASFKAPGALFAVKEMVKEQIRNLEKYLAELDEMPSVP